MAIALAAFETTASAVVLDWDSVVWTNGQTTGSFDIDPANAGNDVTVTLTGNNGATFVPDITAGNIQTPAVASVFQGGLAATEKTLVLGLNLTSNTQSVTLALDFSSNYTAGILQLTFRIFDVDFANASGNTYQDILSNIRGQLMDGTWVAPTITTSASNALGGSDLAQTVTGTGAVADTGAGSGNGNVTISFGANAIKRFEFTYGSGAAFANPTFQHVGFYDFTFTPVPEINPAWSAVLSCVVAGGLVLRHRAICRRK